MDNHSGRVAFWMLQARYCGQRHRQLIKWLGKFVPRVAAVLALDIGAEYEPIVGEVDISDCRWSSGSEAKSVSSVLNDVEDDFSRNEPRRCLITL